MKFFYQLYLFRMLTGLIIIFPLSGIGQQKNQIDTQGLKQGYWEKKDQAGFLIYQGYFKDDHPVGEFKRYDDSGKLKTISFFSEDGNSNFTKVLYPDGKLMAQGNYIGKEKDSIWNYYNGQGQIISVETYRNGIKHGKWQTNFASGSLSEEMNYVNDTVHGIWIQYFENGQPRLRVELSHGVYHGDYKIFYPDGKVNLEGQYQNDQRVGKWTYYTIEGAVEKTEYYRNGELIDQ